jgi:hypothetical protein
VLLLRRLSEVGLGGERPVEIHENRTVLVSITKQGALRLHRGFAYAPDRILQALVVFAHPEAQAGEQRRAEQAIVAFPTDDFLGPGRRRRRPERVRPGDRPVLGRLRALHEELNRRHFGGTLGPVPIRLSRRMRTRLGELTVDPGGHQPLEIAVSRQHVEHDGWEEVMHTLLHEMVHQWQVESGQEADHGPGFRRKAREVGVEPVAMRDVRAQPRPA